MKLKSFLVRVMVGVTRQTPAYSAAYRPAPPTLMGQIWAGLTRNTPAFTGARASEASVNHEGQDLKENAEVRQWKVGPALWKSLAWVLSAAAVVAAVVLVLVYWRPSTGAHHVTAAPPTSGVAPVVIVAFAALAVVYWRFAFRILTLVLVVLLVWGVIALIQH
jgi:hypothetical protein